MKKILNCLTLFLLIGSCKYDDGPLLSLSSPEKRIEGYYQVYYVTEDGVDKIDEVNSRNISYWHFGNEDAYPSYHFAFTFNAFITNSVLPYNSSWYLSEDKTELITGTFGCGGLSPPDSIVSPAPVPGFLSNGNCGSTCSKWTITKLTANKLWLKTTFNNKDYEVHLKELK